MQFKSKGKKLPSTLEIVYFAAVVVYGRVMSTYRDDYCHDEKNNNE